MNIITSFFILSGILLSILVYIDTRKHKQSMRIMGIVWPLTMLWASWIGLIAYISFGRQKHKAEPMDMDHKMDMPHSKWQGIALSTLHCGAGCTLADIIGESITAGLGLSLITGWSMDYVLALMIGVYFQYMAIQQMGRLSPKMAIGRALKSDILSLTAWQVGMYGFMAIYLTCFSESVINRASSEFWFVMQLAMIAGFILSYPMNILLIKIGLKHAM